MSHGTSCLNGYNLRSYNIISIITVLYHSDITQHNSSYRYTAIKLITVISRLVYKCISISSAAGMSLFVWNSWPGSCIWFSSCAITWFSSPLSILNTGSPAFASLSESESSAGCWTGDLFGGMVVFLYC